jgi:ferredoxin
MRFITTEDLNHWVDQILQEATVIAPKLMEKSTSYERIKSSREISWNSPRPRNPIKEYFFFPTEQILTFQKNSEGIQIDEIIPHRKRIILGARPCDIRGLDVLDAMFIDTHPPDTHYKTRRQNTVLVGLACQDPTDTCFCTSLGSAPNDKAGTDIFLTPVTDGFLLEILTPQGEELAAELILSETDIKPPPPPELKPVPILPPGSWSELFDNSIWEETAERCLSCRVCAYLCPTCRCFDIRDEPISSPDGKQYFERIRIWDSCASEAYRKIAGGHNPRAAKGERLRNRLYCKFDYYPSQYGPTACTGCGRCIEACPVNIDITETLLQITEIAHVR